MIPGFNAAGNLPSGVHWATWKEVIARYGVTPHRRRLLTGLLRAMKSLQSAGCGTIYVDGSFVTAKQTPGDFDCCWDADGVDANKLDPVLLQQDNFRAAQKAKFFGELFPADFTTALGHGWLQFFQTDKNTAGPKGIIAIDLTAEML